MNMAILETIGDLDLEIGLKRTELFNMEMANSPLTRATRHELAKLNKNREAYVASLVKAARVKRIDNALNSYQTKLDAKLF